MDRVPIYDIATSFDQSMHCELCFSADLCKYHGKLKNEKKTFSYFKMEMEMDNCNDHSLKVREFIEKFGGSCFLRKNVATFCFSAEKYSAVEEELQTKN